MAKHGKRYQDALRQIEHLKKYSLEEAVELVKKTSFTKFDATVEVSFNTSLDPKYAEQNLRGALLLPNGSGKVPKVLVLAKSQKAEEAKKAGADFVGDDDMIQKIESGWLDFEVLIATPDMMGKLGKLGKLLGPKGLMPNAKTGTVTMDVEKAVKEIKAGKIEYRVDKSGNIQVIAGKTSFETPKLVANIKAICEVILQARPSALKGVYVKNVSLSSTMSPGVKLDFEGLR